MYAYHNNYEKRTNQNTSTILISAVLLRGIFVANLRTFLPYNLQVSKMWRRTKMRNMRYAAPQTVPVENFCHVENIFILKKNYESWKWKHPTCFVILNTAMTQCQMSGIGSRMTDIQADSIKEKCRIGKGRWSAILEIDNHINFLQFDTFFDNSYKYVVKAQFIKSWLLSGRKVCAIRRKLLWAKRRKTDQPRKLWVTSTSDSVCRIHSNNCTGPRWRTRTEKKQLKDV